MADERLSQQREMDAQGSTPLQLEPVTPKMAVNSPSVIQENSQLIMTERTDMVMQAQGGWCPADEQQ